jgi:opacity protein-like surface antigen
VRKLVAALALVCLVPAGTAQALPFLPAVGISYPVPAGSSGFSDTYDGQWGISGTISILPTPILKTGLEIGYWSFGQKSGIDTGGDLYVVDLAAVALVHIPGMKDKLKPYGRGGLGVFWTDTKNGNNTDFGFLIGAGTDYGLAPAVSLYLDISYYDAGGAQFLPITLGVRF